jgi:hypothetical protein
VFFFSFSEKQFAKLRNFAKNKTLRKLAVRAGICFFYFVFGARGGWRGVGFGASVKVGGAVVRLFFRLFFSSSSSSSYARATRACTKLWFADLDSSSPAAFWFSRSDKRHDELLFLVQGSVELSTIFRFFWFCFGFFGRAAYR